MLKAFGHRFVPYGEVEMRCLNGRCNYVIWPCETEKDVEECLQEVDPEIPKECSYSISRAERHEPAVPIKSTFDVSAEEYQADLKKGKKYLAKKYPNDFNPVGEPYGDF